VGLGLNMAGVAIFGSVTWHTSNVSVIDHTMSRGSNNLLVGLLTGPSYTEGRCGVVGSTLAFGSIGHGFESGTAYFHIMVHQPSAS